MRSWTACGADEEQKAGEARLWQDSRHARAIAAVNFPFAFCGYFFLDANSAYFPLSTT